MYFLFGGFGASNVVVVGFLSGAMRTSYQYCLAGFFSLVVLRVAV